MLKGSDADKLGLGVGEGERFDGFQTYVRVSVGEHPPDVAKDKKRAGIKALAMLLVHWGKALDKGKGAEEDDDMDEDGEQSEGSRRGRTKEVVSIIGPEQKGRTALAVDALWDEVPQVGDWESLLELLQLDHSASEDPSSQSRGKKKGRQAGGESAIDEVWRLEEVEEGVLLEVLLAALRKAKAIAAGGKKVSVSLVHRRFWLNDYRRVKKTPSLRTSHELS